MKRLLIILAVCLALMPLLKSNAWGAPVSDIGPVVHRDHNLSVDLWTDRMQDEVYGIGDQMEVYFRANSDCYVTIYSIDTDGNVDILFPQYPDDGYVFGGMTYRLPDYYDAMDLRLRGPRGVGYLHAAASRRPNAFRLGVYRGRYHLDVAPIAGDPFLAINSINTRLIGGSHLHAVATVSFFVGSRVWYPRYMCYDCHGRTVHFDPYRDACARYSVRLTRQYDYWWGYNYYPASARFSYVGPFWRFELRTIPAYRHRRIRYIDCAFGFGNYYPVRPITRPVRHVVYRPTHTRALYTRNFRPVTYRDTRIRRSGTIRAGSTATGGSRGSISRSSERSIDRSRSSTGGTSGVSRSRSSTGGTSSIDRSRSRNGTTSGVSRSRSSTGSSSSVGTRGRTGSTSGYSRSAGDSRSRGLSRTQPSASPDRTSTRSSRSTPALRSSSPSSSPNRSRSVTPSSSSSRSRPTTRSTSPSSRRGSSVSRDRSGSDDRRMSIGGRSGGDRSRATRSGESRSSAGGRTRSR